MFFKHTPAAAALLLLTSAAWLAPAHAIDGIQIFTSGAHFYKRVVTNTNPQTTINTVFADLPGANTVVFVPPQATVLFNVNFDAETRCSGGGTGQSWCEAQILIGGVEGSPQASTFGADTFALDSTNGGSDGVGSWESHAFSRHRCVRNTTNAPMAVAVRVQWRISNPTAAIPTEFWVDDSSLVVQMSRDCNVINNPGTPGAADTAARGLPSHDAQSE